MEYYSDEHEVVPDMPVSPTGQYFNSSVLQVSVLGVLESEIPLDDLPAMALLKDVFLPINPRFSSTMVEDKKGVKKWKRVEVKLEDHINVPSFPAGMTPGFYDDYFNDYLSQLSLDPLPQNKPLWEIHLFKYPTSNAAGSIIFKLHHALGDGFSLMGALLSCLQRADNPSLPLTFPSRESSTKRDETHKGVLRCLGRVFSRIGNTISDFGSTLIKSNIGGDEPTPIRSGEDGVEFRPSIITTVTFSLDRIKQIKAQLGVETGRKGARKGAQGIGHVGNRWDPSKDDQKAEKVNLEAGIDTGNVLYRYPSTNQETEATGIDTGLLLYRYRGPYFAHLTLPRVLTLGGYLYLVFTPN